LLHITVGNIILSEQSARLIKKMFSRKRQNTGILNITSICCLISIPSFCNAFSPLSYTSFTNGRTTILRKTPRSCNQGILSMIRAPPGSGYAEPEDELSYFPDTYEPMMEYPGSMRPGSKEENQPYSSLPIQESDPDPIPWPHFQEIEWHHNWGSPHEHPIPMEEFIEMEGRWATAEMEAEMRAGARRGVRERRELEESQKAASFILDDDEDDDELEEQVQLDLGQGVNALIGTDGTTDTNTKAPTTESAEVDEDEDEGDDFLLDLGLDGDGDGGDDSSETEENDGEQPAFATGDSPAGILEAMQTMIDAEGDSEEPSGLEGDDIGLDFDDLDLDFDADDDDDEEVDGDEDDEGFVLMDDDDMGDGEDMVPLDDMIGNEDMGDDDEFDDGGFDYD